MATSRRRFLTLVTAGSAALLTGARPALPQTKAARARRARPAAVRAEVETQIKYVAKQLQAVRSFSLPPGSEMGFAFRPLPARKRRKGAPR